MSETQEGSVSLVKNLEGVILGPSSPFQEQRIEKRKDWLPIVESAKTVLITDLPSYELAVQHGRALQFAEKSLGEFFTPVKKEIDSVKKVVLEAEKADIGTIQIAKQELGSKVQTWDKEQARIREEEQRVLREQARKEEEERRLAEAIELEAQGDKEEAGRILDAPVLPPPVIVQSVVQPTVAGKVSRKTYKAQVTDFKLLVKSVVQGQVPYEALKADDVFLNRQAVGFREGLNYPGVTVVATESTSFRS